MRIVRETPLFVCEMARIVREKALLACENLVFAGEKVCTVCKKAVSICWKPRQTCETFFLIIYIIFCFPDLTLIFICSKLADVKQFNFIIMEKTPIRLFSMSFDDVITKAQSMQPQFALDIPKFYGFNPWFTNAVNAQLVA